MARITIDTPDDPQHSVAADGTDNGFSLDRPDTGNVIDIAALPDASPIELVEQAGREYAAGKDREWAGTLLAALQKTFLDLGKANGIADHTVLNIGKALDAKDRSGRKFQYSGHLSSANMLSYHHRTGAVPDYWHEPLYYSVVKFIGDCHGPAP